jgi:hypothetical protein
VGRGLERLGAARFRSLRSYNRTWLGAETVAALTVWAILGSEALGYATMG